MLLQQMKDHVTAAEVAEGMLRHLPDDPQEHLRAAAIFAQGIPLAESDGKLPDARRRELAQRYADLAAKALREAVGLKVLTPAAVL
jgi:hypothetical protein